MRVEGRGRRASRDSWRPTTRLSSCVSSGVRARNILARPSQLSSTRLDMHSRDPHQVRIKHQASSINPSLLFVYSSSSTRPLLCAWPLSENGLGSRRTNRTLQPISTRLLVLVPLRVPRLLNPLLPFLQAQQPCIALAAFVLRAYQRANHGVVRHLGQSLLVRLDLGREAVQLGPVDLLLR
jgi:hypothetical protein